MDEGKIIRLQKLLRQRNGAEEYQRMRQTIPVTKRREDDFLVSCVKDEPRRRRPSVFRPKRSSMVTPKRSPWLTDDLSDDHQQVNKEATHVSDV